jgi:hypothetical protein
LRCYFVSVSGRPHRFPLRQRRYTHIVGR